MSVCMMCSKKPFSSVKLRILRVSILSYPELRFSGSAMNFCLYLYMHCRRLLYPPLILGKHQIFLWYSLISGSSLYIYFLITFSYSYIVVSYIFCLLITWFVSEDPFMPIRQKEKDIACLSILWEWISFVCYFLSLRLRSLESRDQTYWK